MFMKKILISGASSGIGLATAKRLIEKDFTVIGLARDFSKTPLTSKNFVPLEIDLSDLKKLSVFLNKLIKEHPDISSLVLNAGSLFSGKLEQLSFEQIENSMNLNFLSHSFLVKAFLPLLKKQKKGDIIFIGSSAALKGKKEGSIYCASKFALRGFSQALKEECSTSSVRVSIIQPDLVDTAFYDKLHFRPKKDHALTAEDIAETIDFILHLNPSVVIDEILISSQKRALDFSRSDPEKI